MADEGTVVFQAFSRWDVDGDKKISTEELTNALTSVGVSAESIPDLFASADVNSDGFIDYEEFLRWVFLPDVPAFVQEAALGNEAMDTEILRSKLGDAKAELERLQGLVRDQKDTVNQLEQQVNLRDKLTENMQKEACEEHNKKKAHWARQMYIQEFDMRPKIDLPLEAGEWTFQRVVTKGKLVPDKGRVLSLVQGEDGSIVVMTPGGGELTRVPAPVSLMQASAFKDALAKALGIDQSWLTLWEGERNMDDQDLVADLSLITVQQLFDADFTCGSGSVLNKLLEWKLDSGVICDNEEVEGHYLVERNGEPFAELKQLQWRFRKGYMGFHTSNDVRNLRVEAKDGFVVAVGSAAKYGFHSESGPSSISGPWDCMPRGADYKKLFEEGKRRVSEKIAQIAGADVPAAPKKPAGPAGRAGPGGAPAGRAGPGRR